MRTKDIPMYFLQNGDEQNVPFEIVSLEIQKENYDYGKPHRHNYFEIFCFREGGGAHEIDFVSFPIADHSIHFVSPGQVHQVKRAPGSHGHVMLFRRDFFFADTQQADSIDNLPFFYHNSPRPLVNITADARVPLYTLMQQLQEEYTAHKSGKLDVLRAFLSILLIQARRLHEKENRHNNNGSQGHGDQAHRFRRLIEQHFHTIHSVSEYAALLCISPNHLNDISRKALGRSASDLIHDRLVLEAKRLLYHSDASIKEISFLLNFQDPSYFGRFFRKQVGMAPGEFRSKIREMYQ